MTRTFVFIDSRIADYQTLIAGLGADAEWVLLDAYGDGIAQMQSALAGYSGLDSIQIVSHGTGVTVLSGTTVLDASTGTDTTSYAYDTAAVTVSLAVSTDQSTGGSGSDTLTAIENLTGSAYADKLTGSTGTNPLDGGASNDTLTGGLGSDRLTGGTGSDTFRFVTTGDGSDTITDFASGTDKIHIVAANFGLTAGAGANLVINGTPSSAAAAFVYNSTTGILSFDSNGNGAGAATQLAMLSNKPVGFNSADFVLGA